jgi:hypothetical protein
MIKNVTDLTEELCASIVRLKTDPLFLPRAAEIGNLAGKVISGHKASLEYYRMRKEKPEIAFLEISNGSKKK